MLILLLLAADWPTARGPLEATQAAPGVGAITATAGGYPIVAATGTWGSPGFEGDQSVVGEFDGDPLPEIIGITRSQAVLWDDDGTVIATSSTFSGPDVRIRGVYDLDGDGSAFELIVVAPGLGGGVIVLDVTTLAEIWSSPDPGDNTGVELSELATADVDGDGSTDVAWLGNGSTLCDFHAVSFATGTASASVVDITVPASYCDNPTLVAGNWSGARGDPRSGFAINEEGDLLLLELVDASDPGATCSDDGVLCIGPTDVFADVFATITYSNDYTADLGGDDDHELVTASSYYSVSLTAFDPSAGLASGGAVTADGLLWQYDYAPGGSHIDVATRVWAYSGAGQDVVSSTGESVVAIWFYGDTDAETDHDGIAADDCLDSDGFGSVVFDGVTGTPLAVLEDALAMGSVDTDADGVTEIVFAEVDSYSGLGQAVVGYELACTGATNAAAWSSCGATGCTLVEQWRVDGALATFAPQDPDGDEGHYISFLSTFGATSIIDLDGDALPEVIVEDGGDLVAWAIDSVGVPVELGRYTLGACDDLSAVYGEGAGAWLLLEGSACFTVLDATLVELASFDVAEVQGSAEVLLADVGETFPVLMLDETWYPNPSTSAGLAAPSGTIGSTPTLAVDVDGDDADELLTWSQSGSVVTLRLWEWDGAAWGLLWATTTADLGTSGAYTSNNANFAAGDFDGDGDGDIAAFVWDTATSQGSVDCGVLYFLDGADGSEIAAQAAPASGNCTSANTRSYAADVCDGVVCPGTDGRDEVILALSHGITVYDAVEGYVEGGTHDDSTNEGAYADFDGDGALEYAEATDDADVRVMELDGAVVWAETLGSFSAGSWSMANGDLDGDALDDVLVAGGYGELFAYAGDDGSPISGFPVYLTGGAVSTSAPADARTILKAALADIDGDGSLEAIIGHDDGYLYALDVATSEGAPALRWNRYFGSAVEQFAISDVTGDGLLDVVVVPADGTVSVVSGGSAYVTIDTPSNGDCTVDAAYTVSGTAEAATEVQVYLNSSLVATAAVSAGAWTSGPFLWPTSGLYRLEAYGIFAGNIVATASARVAWREDDDGDGYSECDPEDCDDADATVYPSADEHCDGTDEDCDGEIDETDAVDAVTWYGDADGDGYGDASVPTPACSAPAGYVADDTDCDDTSANTSPVGTETPYDGLDQDCDGTDLTDVDADGYDVEVDCDDDDAALSPASTETADGVDQNCDGTVDEGTNAFDDDGDGFTEDGGDCDDTDGTLHPGAIEIADGVDQDCDGALDEETSGYDDDGDGYADDDCHDGDATIHPGAAESANGIDDDCDRAVDDGTEAFDDDGDGYTEQGEDCDDADASRHPGATEGADGVDQDCDGLVDDGTVAYDDDGDGYTEQGGDCDDSDAAVSPGAVEYTNGCDDDCNGIIDEDGDTSDDDGDGWSELDGDCDDAAGATYPGATETNDGADEDCDGRVDDGTGAFDDDGDGWAEIEGDCDDASTAIGPSVAELCTPVDDKGEPYLDGIDENCDGTVDEGCLTEEAPKTSGCGCDAGGGAGASLLAIAAVLFALRRRMPAVVLLATGCGQDIAVVVKQPEAVLHRDLSYVDFRTVTVGGEGAVSLELRNVGDAAIGVTAARFEPELSVSFATDPVGTEIGAAGGGADYLTLDLRYSPTAAEAYSGTLVLDLSDADLYELEIPVYGTGTGADLRFVPGTLDFGPVSPAESSQTAILWNAGDASVTIASVTLPRSEWPVSALLEGLTLAAGESAEVEVATLADAVLEDELVVTLAEGGEARLALRANVCDEATPIEDVDGDGFTVCAGDCDDASESVHPGAAETMRGRDDDCDGVVDNGTIYADDDGDGATEEGGDCDDTNLDVYPGSAVVLEGVDADCDGVLEGSDTDGDGWSDALDCNPTDDTIHPGAAEETSGVDDDCDGFIDEGTAAYDDDGDGYAAEDCHDGDGAVHPDAAESANGIDDDCDGAVDEGTDSSDDDDDGWTEAGGDCDDADSAVNPGAIDVSGDGPDADCDGVD